MSKIKDSHYEDLEEAFLFLYDNVSAIVEQYDWAIECSEVGAVRERLKEILKVATNINSRTIKIK